MGTSRHQLTHARLVDCALDLFEVQGYEQTTVAQIAESAGVTQMTFFRHFASKDLVVATDPYDPAMAGAVGARPRHEPALLRAARGVRDALQGMSEPETEQVRRRVRVIAASPALRSATVAHNTETEARIAEQLVADGTDPVRARSAAAALLSALTAALYAWADHEELAMTAAISAALDMLEHARE